jgi:hypothetical protein
MIIPKWIQFVFWLMLITFGVGILVWLRSII